MQLIEQARQAVSRLMRSSGTLCALIDHAPVRCEFIDGVTRKVPRHLWRLIRTWLRNPGLKAESEAAYAAFRGGDFLDIGAFHGWYSVLLAPKAPPGSTFVSMEPDLRALPQLLLTLAACSRLFPELRFCAIACPAGTGAALAVQCHAGGGEHPAFVGRAEPGTGVASVVVDQVVTSLQLQPAMIKIDVEGAEWSVLQGMKSTLAAFQPAIQLETHPMWMPEGEVDRIRSFLGELGYVSKALDERHHVWTAS